MTDKEALEEIKIHECAMMAEKLNGAIEEYIDHVRFDIPDYIVEKINDCAEFIERDELNLVYYLNLGTRERLINKLMRRTMNIKSTSGEFNEVYDSIEDFINIEELNNDISLIYVIPYSETVDIHELSSKLSDKVTYTLRLKDCFLFIRTPEKTYLVAMESPLHALRSLLKSGYTYIKKDGDYEIYYKRDH